MGYISAAMEVVIPVFILIAVGYTVRIADIVSVHSFKNINALVYRVLLPVLLFDNMYHIDIEKEVGFGVVVFAVTVVLVLFLVLIVVVPCFVKERGTAASIIQGIYRSNFALFGIAITESMYGKGNAGVTGVLVSLIVPLFNVLAVVLFEGIRSKHIRISQVMIAVIKNPLIIGTSLGALLRATEIPVHAILQDSISMIGALASPVSLISLGGCFSFRKTIQNKWKLVVVSAMRLLVVPLIVVFLGIELGFRDKALFSLYIMSGAPTAIASFSMASEMGGDGELAGEIIIVTTVLSVVTCIAFISTMSACGYI